RLRGVRPCTAAHDEQQWLVFLSKIIITDHYIEYRKRLETLAQKEKVLRLLQTTSTHRRELSDWSRHDAKFLKGLFGCIEIPRQELQLLSRPWVLGADAGLDSPLSEARHLIARSVRLDRCRVGKLNSSHSHVTTRTVNVHEFPSGEVSYD
ncbi:hypothetical protein J6590_040030, partial [Homalodisca vitripennis]